MQSIVFDLYDCRCTGTAKKTCIRTRRVHTRKAAMGLGQVQYHDFVVRHWVIMCFLQSAIVRTNPNSSISIVNVIKPQSAQAADPFTLARFPDLVDRLRVIVHGSNGK